jgi:hypothetical protein
MQWVIITNSVAAFSSDINQSIMESIKNILRIGDREHYGSSAFFNAWSWLFKTETTFTQALADVLKNAITKNENRATVTSVNLIRVDKVTFRIEINLITLQGQELNFSLDVQGF